MDKGDEVWKFQRGSREDCHWLTVLPHWLNWIGERS
jgi:hypothetical protein